MGDRSVPVGKFKDKLRERVEGERERELVVVEERRPLIVRRFRSSAGIVEIVEQRSSRVWGRVREPGRGGDGNGLPRASSVFALSLSWMPGWRTEVEEGK